MMNLENQRVLDVLNSLEIVESNGGDHAYALVEKSEENLQLLHGAGITMNTINKYGNAEERAFCVLSLATGEGYANLYTADGTFLNTDHCLKVTAGDQDVYFHRNQEEEVIVAVANPDGTVPSIVLDKHRHAFLNDITKPEWDVQVQEIEDDLFHKKTFARIGKEDDYPFQVLAFMGSASQNMSLAFTTTEVLDGFPEELEVAFRDVAFQYGELTERFRQWKEGNLKPRDTADHQAAVNALIKDENLLSTFLDNLSLDSEENKAAALIIAYHLQKTRKQLDKWEGRD